MDPIKISLGSMLISAAAMIVSLLTFVWTVKQHRRDQARITTKVELEVSANSGTGTKILNRDDLLTGNYPTAKAQLVIRVVNVGRRPIRIAQVYGKMKLPRWWKTVEVTSSLPAKAINETEPQNIHIAVTPVVSDLRKLCIRDSTNKKWNVDSKSFKVSQAEAKQLGFL